MARNKKKRSLIIVVIILAVLLVTISAIAILNAMKGKEKDPFTQKEQSTSSTSDTKDTTDSSKPSTDDTKTDTPDSDADKLDPATVATITVEPMGLIVSYVKGAGGFSYEVSRTTDGRRLVSFSSEELVGTKCTDDAGVFVSILQSPNENEKATVSKTVDVDGVTYGLSIASNTCTSDSASLKAYQDSFSRAFSLLKKSS